MTPPSFVWIGSAVPDTDLKSFRIPVMKPNDPPDRVRPGLAWWRGAAILLSLPVWASQAQASIFKGETLDRVSDIMAWVVLIVAPVIGLAVFWLVHILPEKIAEKRHHPQAKAIQTLCLLSLFFGGLLWPLAWLWAYSKPVLYKMAYGTDKMVHGEEEHGDDAAAAKDEAAEVGRLRQRIAELESKLSGANAPTGEKG